MTRLEVLQHVDDGLPEFPLPGLISCHLAFECPRHCALKLKLSTLTEQKVCHAGASPFVPPDRSYPEPLTSPILAHTVLDHLTQHTQASLREVQAVQSLHCSSSRVAARYPQKHWQFWGRSPPGKSESSLDFWYLSSVPESFFPVSNLPAPVITLSEGKPLFQAFLAAVCCGN